MLLAMALLSGCAGISPGSIPADQPARIDAASAALTELLLSCRRTECPVDIALGTTVLAVESDEDTRIVEVRFSEILAHRPFRPASIEALYLLVGEQVEPFFPDYTLRLWAAERPVETLVPNYFRTDPGVYDRDRMALDLERPTPIVQNASRAWHPSSGLAGRYVALWPSHGWYYEQARNRWEWQRARLFQTIEDLLPMAFTHAYIVPMLERAGATVFLPRERDLQIHEVIVDNDSPDSGYTEMGVGWRTAGMPGFAIDPQPYGEGVNPFRLGTYRVVETAPAATAEIRWAPDIPQTGDYAVHIAYAMDPGSATDAHYTVHHTGGATHFRVNQQIGGGTWVYLGTFRFEAGRHPQAGGVTLTNRSSTPDRLVSADAVRFGGGMGIVESGGTTSQRPRWTEGARYYMQFAGMPDSLVYNLSGGQNDYTDDFRGRPEWVNYLRGAPYGPNRDRSVSGLGIPIDVSLAFHTDAGVSRSDTTIGTLMIYSTEGAATTDAPVVVQRPIPPRAAASAAGSRFPDGVSRLANRDFADILQTQIVDDIRSLYDPAWTRRGLWDRDYAEAVRPNVPSVLLELLSHQNFLDMQYAMDPRFRFHASRAIYKGVLRFIASHHGTDYVVQPLPVSHFQATLAGQDGVTLRWLPTSDPLEPSAEADAYVVYTRIGDRGFDNGFLVHEPEVTLTGLGPDLIYSYRVTAVNAGGESFPSETLSVARASEGRGTVLVINGFDRIAPPASLEAGDLTGFASFWDPGVPDRYDLHTVGAQFNFNRADPWVDDDAPGHGASYGNLETVVIPGNTFDFPAVHGASLLRAGYSFASASSHAVSSGSVDLGSFSALNLILGAQKTTTWPKPGPNPEFEALPAGLRNALSGFCSGGGGLFLSGAYVGTDVFADLPDDAPGPTFARETLGFAWRTDHAARTGGIISTGSTLLPNGFRFSFNTEIHPTIYTVGAPDAIEPSDEAGTTVLRYTENNISAAVARRGACPVVTFGFPFETILRESDRDVVMEAVMRYITP